MKWIREKKVNNRRTKISGCPLIWIDGRITFRELLKMWPAEDNIRIRKGLL